MKIYLWEFELLLFFDDLPINLHLLNVLLMITADEH